MSQLPQPLRRLNGWVDGRWSQSATTRSSGVTAVSKLGDPYRPFREHGQELEPAAQRGDVVGQGAHVHVRPPLEARYVGLVDLKPLREFLLRQFTRRADFAQPQIGKHLLRAATDSSTALRRQFLQ
mgnify:CR=1 FL=1